MKQTKKQNKRKEGRWVRFNLYSKPTWLQPRVEKLWTCTRQEEGGVHAKDKTWD
jgi:hypothetical protein